MFNETRMMKDVCKKSLHHLKFQIPTALILGRVQNSSKNTICAFLLILKSFYLVHPIRLVSALSLIPYRFFFRLFLDQNDIKKSNKANFWKSHECKNPKMIFILSTNYKFDRGKFLKKFHGLTEKYQKFRSYSVRAAKIIIF